MSSTTLCSREVRSVCRLGSLALSSRANSSVAPIMESISAIVDSILSRSRAFSTVSARSRSSVNGVRRSCEMAASRRVRFSIKLRKPRLHVVEGARGLPGLGGAGFGQGRRVHIVAEPVGSHRRARPSGAVTRRTAHTDTARMMIAITAIERRN